MLADCSSSSLPVYVKEPAYLHKAIQLQLQLLESIVPATGNLPGIYIYPSLDLEQQLLQVVTYNRASIVSQKIRLFFFVKIGHRALAESHHFYLIGHTNQKKLSSSAN